MFYKDTRSVQREHNDVKSHHSVSKAPPNYLANDISRGVSLTYQLLACDQNSIFPSVGGDKMSHLLKKAAGCD